MPGAVGLRSGGVLAGIHWPDGIATSDVEFILLWTVVSAVVVTAVGMVALRLYARRSLRIMILGVVLVSVLTSMAGVAVIAHQMLAGLNQGVVYYLMAIAGLAGTAAALIVGRQLTRASRALSSAVNAVGDSGVYVAPDRPLPIELSGLSDALAVAHERLNAARTRERALEASRRELVAWVSHDLRTPLAGLRAMAEALEDQVVVDPRTVSQYHTQIRTEVDRLSTMIDDLFELSRIHAGALRLSRRMVGLEDVVAEVVASTEPVARAKGVRLTGAAVRGMPVFVDSAELGRALRNLVTNAIRHTPADGVVDVLAEVQSGMAAVCVSDACGGIPPEDLPRVFDVAFRGESARTPVPNGGGGLGLSIARGIVEAHSGQIAVRNAGPGCQFLIRLPLGPPTGPSPMADARTGPQPAAGRRAPARAIAPLFPPGAALSPPGDNPAVTPRLRGCHPPDPPGRGQKRPRFARQLAGTRRPPGPRHPRHRAGVNRRSGPGWRSLRCGSPGLAPDAAGPRPLAHGVPARRSGVPSPARRPGR